VAGNYSSRRQRSTIASRDTCVSLHPDMICYVAMSRLDSRLIHSTRTELNSTVTSCTWISVLRTNRALTVLHSLLSTNMKSLVVRWTRLIAVNAVLARWTCTLWTTSNANIYEYSSLRESWTRSQSNSTKGRIAMHTNCANTDNENTFKIPTYVTVVLFDHNWHNI